MSIDSLFFCWCTCFLPFILDNFLSICAYETFRIEIFYRPLSSLISSVNLFSCPWFLFLSLPHSLLFSLHCLSLSLSISLCLILLFILSLIFYFLLSFPFSTLYLYSLFYFSISCLLFPHLKNLVYLLESVAFLDYVTAYIACLSSDRIDGLYTTVGTSLLFQEY